MGQGGGGPSMEPEPARGQGSSQCQQAQGPGGTRSICRGREGLLSASLLASWPSQALFTGNPMALAAPRPLCPASGASCPSPNVTPLVSLPGCPRATLGCLWPCPALASAPRCMGLWLGLLSSPPGPWASVLFMLATYLLLNCSHPCVLWCFGWFSCRPHVRASPTLQT